MSTLYTLVTQPVKQETSQEIERILTEFEVKSGNNQNYFRFNKLEIGKTLSAWTIYFRNSGGGPFEITTLLDGILDGIVDYAWISDECMGGTSLE